MFKLDYDLKIDIKNINTIKEILSDYKFMDIYLGLITVMVK